jgi:hypothetical protein
MSDDASAKWQNLPARIEPEDWVTEHDADPVPGSVTSADAERQFGDAVSFLSHGYSPR